MRDARFAIALLCVCCGGLLVPDSAAQDQMARVKELYVSASYIEALRSLDKVEFVLGGSTPESAEYRILCLLALGEQKKAQAEIEKLFVKHPSYRPDPLLIAPGVQTQFEKVRQRLLPQIIRNQYDAAKAHLDAKEYREAVGEFDRVLELLKDADNDSQLADLRLIVVGFRDLARASLPASTPLPARPVGAENLLTVTPAVAAPAESEGPIYDASVPDVIAPVPLKPILPPLSRAFSTPTPTPGVFEILIDEKGQVESAVVRHSISPQYDRFFLREARNWRYQPATLNGKAVRFRKVIEIYTTTVESIGRD
jgi:tetratricopeptide (TPR) repeat protein